MGLENISKTHDNPTLHQPLLKHESSEPATDEGWKYRSALEKISYLSKNKHPDIAYAVYQCEKYQSNPRKPHYNAIK